MDDLFLVFTLSGNIELHIHIQCVSLQGEDDEHIKPKAQSLKNPQFLTHNGCAEYYPIWKTPLFVGGRLKDLINGSSVDKQGSIAERKLSYEKDLFVGGRLKDLINGSSVDKQGSIAERKLSYEKELEECRSMN